LYYFKTVTLVEKIERLQQIVQAISGMSAEDFALSLPYWQERQYRKGGNFHKPGGLVFFHSRMQRKHFQTRWICS
jgi:hypothetical protein